MTNTSDTPVSDERLIDGETGEVVHPKSTITMPIYEFDKIIRELQQARRSLKEFQKPTYCARCHERMYP